MAVALTIALGGWVKIDWNLRQADMPTLTVQQLIASIHSHELTLFIHSSRSQTTTTNHLFQSILNHDSSLQILKLDNDKGLSLAAPIATTSSSPSTLNLQYSWDEGEDDASSLDAIHQQFITVYLLQSVVYWSLAGQILEKYIL